MPGSADVAPTPVFANGLLYVAADYVKFAAIDVEPGDRLGEQG
jgi:hypothetical protein